MLPKFSDIEEASMDVLDGMYTGINDLSDYHKFVMGYGNVIVRQLWKKEYEYRGISFSIICHKKFQLTFNEEESKTKLRNLRDDEIEKGEMVKWITVSPFRLEDWIHDLYHDYFFDGYSYSAKSFLIDNTINHSCNEKTLELQFDKMIYMLKKEIDDLIDESSKHIDNEIKDLLEIKEKLKEMG